MITHSYFYWKHEAKSVMNTLWREIKISKPIQHTICSRYVLSRLIDKKIMSVSPEADLITAWVMVCCWRMWAASTITFSSTSSWLLSSSWNPSQIEHVTFWHSSCRDKINTVVLSRFSIFALCFTMDSNINWIILVLFSPFDKNEAESLVGTFERIDLIRIFLESLSPRPRLSASFTT